MILQKTRKIILASPRGFCAGVDRAVEIVETCLKLYKPPIYVKHEIVHNRHVVDGMKKQGVIFVEEISEVPESQTVIFSAHGVSPVVWQDARKRNLNIIDATCPLVTKVHLEAKRYASENFKIILIGHKDHVEAIGTRGEAPDHITIVENLNDVDQLRFEKNEKIAYLTQTTLSVQDTREIIERLRIKFPDIECPSKSDICYATTNRQKAVKAISNRVDIMLIIGSQNSSNSNRLRELAENDKCRSFLIDHAGQIEDHWFTEDVTNIGITAGASAPEELVKSVISRLKKDFQAEEIEEAISEVENISFKLPKNLLNISER